jgi:hypothetical protein
MASMADDFRVANREGAPGTVVSLLFSVNRQANPSATTNALSPMLRVRPRAAHVGWQAATLTTLDAVPRSTAWIVGEALAGVEPSHEMVALDTRA